MIGVIQEIDYTKGSGLATLVVLDNDGNIHRLHVDAGPLFRSEVAVGPSYEFTMTDFGTVESIAPMEESW